MLDAGVLCSCGWEGGVLGEVTYGVVPSLVAATPDSPHPVAMATPEQTNVIISLAAAEISFDAAAATVIHYLSSRCCTEGSVERGALTICVPSPAPVG